MSTYSLSLHPSVVKIPVLITILWRAHLRGELRMRKEPVLRDLITSQENAYHPLFSTWGQSFPFIKSRFKLPLPSYSGRWFFFFFLFRNFFFFFWRKHLSGVLWFFLSVVNWSFTENPYPFWTGGLCFWMNKNQLMGLFSPQGRYEDTARERGLPFI